LGSIDNSDEWMTHSLFVIVDDDNSSIHEILTFSGILFDFSVPVDSLGVSIGMHQFSFIIVPCNGCVSKFVSHSVLLMEFLTHYLSPSPIPSLSGSSGLSCSKIIDSPSDFVSPHFMCSSSVIDAPSISKKQTVLESLRVCLFHHFL
jgi:hypothetical protein